MTRIMTAAIAAIALSAAALSGAVSGTAFGSTVLGGTVLGSTVLNAQGSPGTPTKTLATAAAPVNLNTATAEQLATIPGVGPKTAERIIQYRQKNGGFKKVEDLMNVSGVGEKSFLKMKPLITVASAKVSAQNE